MNLPTKLTVMRIILVPVFVAFFILPFFAPGTASFSGFVALGIFLIACLTDFLDGYLARKLNQITTLGKFLDPIADKLLVAAALICVVLIQTYDFFPTNSFFFNSNLQIFILICVILIISRELLISAFRMLAASKNINLAADKLGKIKTIVQMVALIILIPGYSIEYHSRVIQLPFPPFPINPPPLPLEPLQIISDRAQIFYFVGFWFLIVAALITVISGVNYIVKNRQVFREEGENE